MLNIAASIAHHSIKKVDPYYSAWFSLSLAVWHSWHLPSFFWLMDSSQFYCPLGYTLIPYSHQWYHRDGFSVQHCRNSVVARRCCIRRCRLRYSGCCIAATPSSSDPDSIGSPSSTTMIPESSIGNLDLQRLFFWSCGFWRYHHESMTPCLTWMIIIMICGKLLWCSGCVPASE